MNHHQFPVGMHVLAIDNDPTCLTVLQNLLQLCNYKVTTASNGIRALELLRENKNMFDLVIPEINMADIDGFKLLELVGLEMDLPIILLSSNDDPNIVMKGISHGACFYMPKPVRIQELQIIWQHVIRKKITNSVSQMNEPHKKKKNKKENQSLAPKKARLAWTDELNHKFLVAINKLGINEAVPRKILELMNVKNVTRENVASHLQKYRLNMNKMSCIGNQQAIINKMGDHHYMQTQNDAFTSTSNGYLDFKLCDDVLGDLSEFSDLIDALIK